MNVKTLIDLLQALDEEIKDLPVVIDSEDGFTNIKKINVERVHHLIGMDPETKKNKWKASESVVLRG